MAVCRSERNFNIKAYSLRLRNGRIAREGSLLLRHKRLVRGEAIFLFYVIPTCPSADGAEENIYGLFMLGCDIWENGVCIEN